MFEDEQLRTENTLTFYESVFDSTNIIFGSSPLQETNGDRFNLIRFIMIIIGNVVLALALLNFLIAIISGTFERVESDKDLYDVKELLAMIIDYDSLLSGVTRSTEFNNHYFLEIRAVSEEEGQQKLDEIEKKINEIRRIHQQEASERKKDRLFLETKFEETTNKLTRLLDLQSKKEHHKEAKGKHEEENPEEEEDIEDGDKTFEGAYGPADINLDLGIDLDLDLDLDLDGGPEADKFDFGFDA